MSSTPGDVPPPPPSQPPAPSSPPPAPPTQIAGQQSAPSTSVPHTPGLTGYTPAAGKTNSLAIVSLIAGVGSFFAHIIPGVGGFTVAVVAIITGLVARNQIKQTGEEGIWMANAGIIIGLIHIALLFLLALILIFVIFVLGVALFGIAAHSVSSPTPVPSG